MITNPRVLEPEFVPREVQYRDAQIDHLTRALEPVTRGYAPDTVFLFGPSGSGKTCLGKFALDRLATADHQSTTQTVNCWRDYTRYRVLYRVLDGVGKAVDIHRQSTPQDVLVDRLHSLDGGRYVVILDEVDQLEDPAVLYDLYRASNVDMILIANRVEPFLQRLDGRLRSRLQSSTRIRFDRYSLDALVAILQDRVRWGLAPERLDRHLVELVADEAAGDARLALRILRNAALAAELDSRSSLTDADVLGAVSNASADIRQKDLAALKPHQRVLYDIVHDAGPIAPSDLYSAYCSRVDEPRTKRMVRNYLQKLCQYNLLHATGDGPNRRYVPAREPTDETDAVMDSRPVFSTTR